MVSWNPWSETGNLFAAFTENGPDLSGPESVSSSRSNSSNDLASLLSGTSSWSNFSSLREAETRNGSASAVPTANPTTDSSLLSSIDIGSLFCSFRDQHSDLLLNHDKNIIINNNNNVSQPNFQLPIGSSLPKVPLLASEPKLPTADQGLVAKTASDSPNGKVNSTAQYTEQVQVRSSAHVSYIVGKQGTKIRQIRTETETHIKTPVNGEDPVFEISGRRQNVEKAKQRILEEEIAYSKSLFERACNYREGDRRMLNLYLPSRFIGLVVGKKGSSIKRIMEMSSTTIVTPKVNTINIFEIYGTQWQIQRAVELIKKHITSNNDVAITEQANPCEVTLYITPK
ncbi:Mex-3 RNA binding member C [Tyrophagus putrescentiae]|nr:Mex-3 RNA binding member C [Tyrophagus putrescentiae]